MSTGVRATSQVEIPVFFPSGQDTLFGILTEPTSEPVGIAAVLMHGGNLGPSPGRNQMGVRLCRRLSEEGFHAFRFDYHGVGDSTGEVEQFRLDQPFTEDATAAIEWLRGRGIHRFVLIGGCFGSRTALACVSVVPGLVGLVLKAIPVRDKKKDAAGVQAFVPNRTVWGYARRAFRPQVLRGVLSSGTRRAYVGRLSSAWRARSLSSSIHASPVSPPWVSPTVLAGLQAAIDQRVRLLLISGTQDPGFGDFDEALGGSLGQLLGEAGSLADMQVLSGRVGAAADASLHEPVIDLIAEWLGNHGEGDRSHPLSRGNLEMGTSHA